MMQSRFHIFKDSRQLSLFINAHILTELQQALTRNSRAVLGLSGGSAAKRVISSDWPALPGLCIAPIDERYVTVDDEASNAGFFLRDVFQDRSDLQQAILRLRSELPLPEAARDFAGRLQAERQELPALDFVLLGMGPDGHVASLFPEHKLLQVKESAILYLEDSPKPPPCRISFSLPLLSRARAGILLIEGAAKAAIAQQVFKQNDRLPAVQLIARNHNLIVVMDDSAASKLDWHDTGLIVHLP